MYTVIFLWCMGKPLCYYAVFTERTYVCRGVAYPKWDLLLKERRSCCWEKIDLSGKGGRNKNG